MSHKYVLLKEVCEKASSNIAQKDLAECDGIYPIYGASGYIKSVDFFQQAKDYIAIVKDGAGIGRAMKLPAKSSVIGTMQYILPNDNINISYLYYAICSMHLEKYFSGATIPHIYFRDYQNEQLPLPTLEEQAKIANVFGRIDYFIKKEKEQLINLDELVKSRFIEMFGDPIRNDKFWPINKLKEVTIKIGSGATPKGGKESYPNEGIYFIRSLNVHDGLFEFKDLAHLTENQAKLLNNVIVEQGDVLLNITGASVARTCVVPNEILPARVNQHVSIIRCNKNFLNSTFMNRQFLSDSFKRILLNMGEAGGATRQAITKQQLEDTTVIVPPITLQKEYASFVQQVDKSKLAIQQSLDELETLKKSLMQQYFG